MYAYFQKLVYFSTECVFAPNAYRGHTREFLKDLEKIRPSVIMDIIHSGIYNQNCVLLLAFLMLNYTVLKTITLNFKTILFNFITIIIIVSACVQSLSYFPCFWGIHSIILLFGSDSYFIIMPDENARHLIVSLLQTIYYSCLHFILSLSLIILFLIMLNFDILVDLLKPFIFTELAFYNYSFL